jgi:RNA polymerase sigma-70 factor, ECF subfamily
LQRNSSDLTSPKPSLTETQLREEYELIRAAQQNPRRFGVIYERYYEQMFLFIYKRVGDEEQSADLCSQVFLKAMTNLKRYRFQGVPFSAWLYRIATNEVNQFFRDSQKQRMVSLESLSLKDMVEEAEITPTHANVQRMIVVLDSLSPEEIQLIEMRFFEKVPFKEIAVIFNLTETNAKVKVHRLLKKLHRMLNKEYQLNE